MDGMLASWACLDRYGIISTFHGDTPNRIVAVAWLVIRSLSTPLLSLTYSYLISAIEEQDTADGDTVTVWQYLAPFFVTCLNKGADWWFEKTVPLASQRGELRRILVAQQDSLPPESPLAKKWSSPGRFSSLLREVDDLVNGVWGSCLTLLQLFLEVVWIVIMCIGVLAGYGFGDAGEYTNSFDEFTQYIAIFVLLGVTVLLLPYLFFYMYMDKLNECEGLQNDAQETHLSTVGHALLYRAGHPSSPEAEYTTTPDLELQKGDIETEEANRRTMIKTAGEADSLSLLASFRFFFFGLAVKTNYSLLTELWGPFIAYFLLTVRIFGEDTASTVIVLLSLRDLAAISGSVLSLLIDMGKGCRVLEDVSDIVNYKDTGVIGEVIAVQA